MSFQQDSLFAVVLAVDSVSDAARRKGPYLYTWQASSLCPWMRRHRASTARGEQAHCRGSSEPIFPSCLNGTTRSSPHGWVSTVRSASQRPWNASWCAATTAGASQGSSVPNLLSRGIAVLEQLSLGTLSTEQVSAKTGIPKSSAYRILRILEDTRYVLRTKAGPEDLWSVDLRFLALSANILGRVDLKTDIRDILAKLADDTKEIVQLAIWRNGKVLIVDNIKKYTSIISVAREGTSLCINSCVAGLVFGAFLENTEVESALNCGDLPRFTQYTITDPSALRELFVRVRAVGYAIDDQYCAIGHRCVSAPIFDHTGRIAAVVNISGHIQTLSDGMMEEYAVKVMRRAAEASQRMGYYGENCRNRVKGGVGGPGLESLFLRQLFRGQRPSGRADRRPGS